MNTKKGASKTQRRKGIRKGRKGGKRGTKNVVDFASLSETRTFKTDSGTTFVTNTMYSLMNTTLEQYTRATIVAQAYQFYRIKYIQVRVRPSFDTYGTGIATPGSAKPFLYYMIDKSGAIPDNITLEGLKNMGAKPRALDEKVLKFGWKPSVLEQALTQGGGAPAATASKYTISPWLSTSASQVSPIWAPNSVDHLGVYWFVDSLTATNQQPYSVEVEVQFEFKKPLIAGSTGQFSAVRVRPAMLNASRDGVVDTMPGGDDAELVQ